MRQTAACLLAASLLLTAPLNAQMPPLAAGPTLAQAQRAAAAAFRACRGTPIAVAVLDSGGGLKLELTGDGARGLFAEFARRKAATALRFNRPSSATRDAAHDDPALAQQLANDPALIGFGGGLPFAHGAIAVAGAPSQDLDETCARAGLAVLERG
jgi:uncharacterized protein GlcG (DUF336 family)